MAIIKCPECGHQISDKAPICPSCGVEIAGKITMCPQCGEAYFKDKQECPICHHQNINSPVIQQDAPIQATTTQQQGNTDHNKQPNQGKKSHTTLIVSFIIAVLICAVGLYLYNRSNNSKENEAYQFAMQNSDPMILQDYLNKYADAPEEHRDSIEAHLSALKKVDQEWTNTLVSNSSSELKDYLSKHPNSIHKMEAEHKIDSLDWIAVNRVNSEEAFNSYLEDHPNGEHVDEAKSGIKVIKAKTIQPEEKQMISSIFKTFFQSINSKDEDGLTNSVNNILTSFLGKQDATKNDVITFLHKIYKDDILNMTWKLPGDFIINKKEIGDNEYEYSVSFSASQDIEHDNATKVSNKYKVKAKINPDGRITEFNMTRIVE